MKPADRGMFVAAYTRLLTDVWTDPARELQLVEDPRALLMAHGLILPDNVRITVQRDVTGVEPNLEEQVRLWETAGVTGELVLVVPVADMPGTGELQEDELDNIVAGMDSSCACCCPCCCTS
jgi:hypothetical protein